MKVKLSGGKTEDDGFVSIIEPIEGNVCAESWDSDEAAVICKMLNKEYISFYRSLFIANRIKLKLFVVLHSCYFTLCLYFRSEGAIGTTGEFGMSVTQEVLGEVSCTGKELNLAHCFGQWSWSKKTDCKHGPPGVYCRGKVLLTY